jgi:putative membrane protein
MEKLIFAVLHLLGLGIGLGSVWARARTFSGTLDASGLRRLFYADSWWGIAALVWISTGLMRAFGGLEKGSHYYLANYLFHLKMGLFLLIFALEIWPMITLIKWRIATKRGQAIDSSRAPLFSTISYVQAALLVAIVGCAVSMARGYGIR